jgi:hypothetical protein
MCQPAMDRYTPYYIEQSDDGVTMEVYPDYHCQLTI